VAGRPVRNLAGTLAAGYQRATRGWADADTWSLHVYLCSALGGALEHLAGNTHGWPGTPDYSAFEDWTAALHTAAAGLTGRAVRDHDPADQAADAAALAGAQDALRWVADNLPDLWD
jgi:hypothetical protein